MEEEKKEELPKFRGLYRHVKISVKALDCIIVACIAVIIIATIVGLQNPGLTVTFDSRGGTDVAAQKVEYDSLLELPQPPTREGYSFDGWYLDPACGTRWDENNRVQQDMTLYAGWKAK